MTRRCERCGSERLVMRVIGEGSGSFLRKECGDCGSTGPFVPAPEPEPEERAA